MSKYGFKSSPTGYCRVRVGNLAVGSVFRLGNACSYSKCNGRRYQVVGKFHTEDGFVVVRCKTLNGNHPFWFYFDCDRDVWFKFK